MITKKIKSITFKNVDIWNTFDDNYFTRYFEIIFYIFRNIKSLEHFQFEIASNAINYLYRRPNNLILMIECFENTTIKHLEVNIKSFGTAVVSIFIKSLLTAINENENIKNFYFNNYLPINNYNHSLNEYSLICAAPLYQYLDILIEIFQKKEHIEMYGIDFIFLKYLIQHYEGKHGSSELNLSNLKHLTLDSLPNEDPKILSKIHEDRFIFMNKILAASPNLNTFEWHLHFGELFNLDLESGNGVNTFIQLISDLHFKKLSISKITYPWFKNLAIPLIRNFQGDYLKLNLALNSFQTTDFFESMQSKKYKHVNTYFLLIQAFFTRIVSINKKMNILSKFCNSDVNKLILQFSDSIFVSEFTFCSIVNGVEDYPYYGILKNKIKAFYSSENINDYTQFMQQHKITLIIEQQHLLTLLG